MYTMEYGYIHSPFSSAYLYISLNTSISTSCTFITHQVHLVLPICAQLWGYPLKYGKPINGHILKKRMIHPYQLVIANSSMIEWGLGTVSASVTEFWLP